MMNRTPAISAQIPAMMLNIAPRPTPRRPSPVMIKNIPSKIHFNLSIFILLELVLNKRDILAKADVPVVLPSSAKELPRHNRTVQKMVSETIRRDVLFERG